MASPTAPNATPTYQILGQSCIKACEDVAMSLKDARRKRKAMTSQDFNEYSNDKSTVHMPVPSYGSAISAMTDNGNGNGYSKSPMESESKSASDDGQDKDADLSTVVYTSTESKSNSPTNSDDLEPMTEEYLQSDKKGKRDTSDTMTVCCCLDL